MTTLSTPALVVSQPKHPRIDALRNARKQFPEAFAHVWPYVTGGLILGCVFLLLSKISAWLSHSLAELESRLVGVGAIVCKVSALTLHAVDPFLHHIAVGFFVSSICVLMYEWGAHFKQVLAQSKSLTETLNNHVTSVLEASARDALRRALQELLGKYSVHLQDPVERVATSAITLCRGGNWSNEAYIAFLGHMLSNVAANAENLADISTEQGMNVISKQDYPLALSDPGELADLVLKNEITALDNGGEYLVVSDISSWSLLPEFTKAQAVAVERGVKIRRIFVYTDPPDPRTPTVLSQHYTFAAAWTERSRVASHGGLYEIRLVKAASLRSMDATLARIGHFGIFRTGRPGDVAIRFTVTEDDLSQLALRTIAHDDDMIARFDVLWRKLRDLTVYERVEHLLRLELASLAKNGSYKVVSDFHSWRDEHLKGFHRDTVEAMKRGDIIVRRVFVYRPEEDVAACRDILRRHYDDMKRLTTGSVLPYEVKVCRLEEVRSALGEGWHFGVFESGPIGDEHKFIVSEATKLDMSDFVLEPSDDQDRSRQMEKFFRDLEPVTVRAKDVLDLHLD